MWTVWRLLSLERGGKVHAMSARASILLFFYLLLFSLVDMQLG